MPIIEGAVSRQQIPQVVGAVYYVDSVNGNDNYAGTSWGTAYKTIAVAVAAAVAGDTIMVKGSFSEAVTVTKVGLKIIGAGSGPNQAVWTSDADTYSLTINATDVWVENIKFRPPAYGSGTPAAILLSSAGYATIRKCRFQGKTGSWYAIYSPVCNSDNVTIEDCEFIYLNTASHGTAILGVESGGLSYSAWIIRRNIFNSCVVAININGRACQIYGNAIAEYGITAAGVVGAVLTMGIDLSGTSSGANAVWGNQLGGTYSATLYVAGASGDQWAGNFNVISGGVTGANPA